MTTKHRATRKHEARLTRIAQIGALVLAVATGVLLVFGVPGIFVAPVDTTLPLPTLDPIARPVAINTTSRVFNTSGVADRFATIGNAPVPAVVASTDPGSTSTTPPLPPPPTDDLKYLGHVGLGSTLLAMIFEGGTQRIAKLNDKLLAGNLIRVSTTEIEVDRDGVRRTIALAPRSGLAITASNPMAGMANASRMAANRNEMMAKMNSQRNKEAVLATNLSSQSPDQRAQWDNNFNTAMQRLLDSGQFKDPGDAKEAAARFADGMSQIQNDIANGGDPGSAEKLMKQLSEDLPTGGNR